MFNFNFLSRKNNISLFTNLNHQTLKHLSYLTLLILLLSCQNQVNKTQQKKVLSTTATSKKKPKLTVVKTTKKEKAPLVVKSLPYNASAGQKRALLAEEAYENPRDQRTYGGNPKAKARGEKLDCSYLIREIEATFQSEEARKIKQQKGYLAPHELVKYNPFFTNKRLYANKLVSLSGKMADVLQKHGFYSTQVADIRLGDYVFIGKGKSRDLKSIGHAMVIHKIDTIGKQIRYYFIDAGYKGLKKVNGKLVKTKRSVRKGYYLTDQGTVWSGKYIRYFKGTGRPK